MKIIEYRVDDIRYNSAMGRNEYIQKDEYNCIFLISNLLGDLVKIGDIIKLEKTDRGYDRRIWVNDKLIIKDRYYSDNK